MKAYEEGRPWRAGTPDEILVAMTPSAPARRVKVDSRADSNVEGSSVKITKKIPPLIAALVLAALPPLAAQTAPAKPQTASEMAAEASRQMRLGDYPKAIELLRAAVAKDPSLSGVRFQLASVLAYLGRFQEAGPEFAAVVAADPENGAARRGEVTALLLENRYADARRKLEQGLEALPRDGQLAHTLARLLATAPDDSVRDGGLAVALALKVFEIKKIVPTGETLAMAYAEVGDFAKAVGIQKEVLEMAKATGDVAQLEPLRERLALYESGKPWRAGSPMEIAMATEPPKPASSP
ncbi:MAG: tetratricopeptide repeat protein [Thermoanaerobaculia bacterium]|nr:tetratricopeptide repeat protein [Thermoanaerobaculia bacterium]